MSRRRDKHATRLAQQAISTLAALPDMHKPRVASLIKGYQDQLFDGRKEQPEEEIRRVTQLLLELVVIAESLDASIGAKLREHLSSARLTEESGRG